MRAYQVVARGMWNDQKFPHLPVDSQLVWFFLFTYPLCGQIGIYRASLAGLYDELNMNRQWTMERYRQALDDLELEGLILLDRERHLIAFPKFWSKTNPQNWPINKNQVIHCLRAFLALPQSPVTTQCFLAFLEVLKPLRQRFGKPFAKRLTKLFSEPLPKSLVIVLSISSYLLEEEIQEKEEKHGLREWPEDFTLSPELIQVGKGFGINPQAEFAKARDFCLASSRKYSNYHAFIRNWFRRASEGRRA